MDLPGAVARARRLPYLYRDVKPTALRILLLLGSLFFSVFAAELALRASRNGTLAPLSGEHVLREPHPTRGWALAPGRRALQRTLDYAVPVAINEQGLRDRPHDYEPAPGVFRIVILGDSFMEAYQVELEDSLPARLESALAGRGVEVVNLGVGGYGTAQQLLQLREDGLRYRPDLVVLAFYAGNDVQNNSRELEREAFGEDSETTWGRPYAAAADLSSALVWTPPDFERMRGEADLETRRREQPARRLWKWIEPALVANAVSRAAAALGAGPARPPRHFARPFLAPDEEDPGRPAWDTAWTVTRRLLLEMRDVARGAGARLVVLLVPAKLQVEADFRARAALLQGGLAFDETRLNRDLARFAREHAIPLLDPTPVLVAESERGPRLYYQLEDHHWNARGHEIATRELVRFLDAGGLLPRQEPGSRSAR
jgi:lysophospholipase L1-like esterase